jgi:hypothetical protein
MREAVMTEAASSWALSFDFSGLYGLTTPLASTDRELVLQLFDDVVILETQFSMGVPKSPLARAVLVPILRRWIVEGVFFKAQKLIQPDQVRFAVSSNSQAIQQCEAGLVVEWMELMIFGTTGVSFSRVPPEHIGPDHQPATYSKSSFQPSPQRPKIFFEQKMFFGKGQFYTRYDVIKMHANALGGVHFDASRMQNESHINEIKTAFGFELKGGYSNMLMGEEIDRRRADPVRRQTTYDATELVAIDTARIFAAGVRASESAFLALLA